MCKICVLGDRLYEKFDFMLELRFDFWMDFLNIWN